MRKFLGENLRMVYGMGGELVAEFDGPGGALKKEYIYGANGLVATIEPGVGTRYVTSDHLGSPRIITGSNGAVISRHDYEPFGEELFEGMGNRTTAQGYSSETDTLRQKFTGKERDNETGLDYFKARYYSSTQGRFTSTDPIIVTTARLFDPQQFNAYAYVRNNPLKFIDPTGLTLTTSGDLHEARRLLREILGVEDAIKRISYDGKNTITVDLSGIDLSKNEGASLLNDVIGSKKHYDLSIGSTVETLGGEIKVRHIANLDNNPDDRFFYRNPPGSKFDSEKPKKGIDGQVAINLDAKQTVEVEKGEKGLELPAQYTKVFHELAEAYGKVEFNRQYPDAHKAALVREEKLREQRPYLKNHYPGGGAPQLKLSK